MKRTLGFSVAPAEVQRIENAMSEIRCFMMIGAVYPRAAEGIAAAFQRPDLAETTTDLSASPALIGPDAVRDLLCHAEWDHLRQSQCPPRQVFCRSKSKPEIGYLQRDLHSF